MRDYVRVIYNETARPFTKYPRCLSRYLFKRFKMKRGEKMLEIGCGRGEFLAGFMDCGLLGYGCDRSNVITEIFPDATFCQVDLEKEALPWPDNYFDCVYSKSVIEHFHDPESLVKEIFRVLKPGGLVVTLCPDWAFNYRIYFEDYTHRTPFMRSSLRDIFLISGFNNVEVSLFRQLPLLWGRGGRVFLALAEITRVLTPSFLRKHSKWVRFSKEIMLLASAQKPLVAAINDGQ